MNATSTNTLSDHAHAERVEIIDATPALQEARSVDYLVEALALERSKVQLLETSVAESLRAIKLGQLGYAQAILGNVLHYL